MNTGTTIAIDDKSHEVTPEFLSHVLATAVEGGSTYWAAVDSESSGDTGADGASDFDASDYLAEDSDEDEEEMFYASASFHPLNDPRNGGTLDLQGVADAIERIASGEAQVPPAVREIIVQAVRDDDASDIDAEAADCIVQIGLFDEIVYS